MRMVRVLLLSPYAQCFYDIDSIAYTIKAARAQFV
jgi:hypothetical protein